MSLFFKNKTYLGVDIGSSSIKVVELTKNKDNVPQLVTYGYSEESTDIVKGNTPESQAKTAALLKAVCKKARVSSKSAMAALPNFFVFSSIINLPASTSKKDLASAISWEAKKFIPIPIEDVALDWKILSSNEKAVNIISGSGANQNQGSSENDFSLKESLNTRPSPESPLAENSAGKELAEQKLDQDLSQSSSEANRLDSQNTAESKFDNNQDGESLNILLTAAPKNLVKKYLDICAAAGLRLLSLETESFALSRSLIGCNPHPVMLIDMGALVSDIIVMEKGLPVLSRSVDVGGNTITQAIMRILNIDINRAEQFKRDFGAPLNVMIGAENASSNANAIGGVPRAISSVLDSLMHEIRYSLNLYQNQTKKHVEKVVLSGGSAFLPNFTDYLSGALSLPVYIGNPWDRVSYPSELKSILGSLAPSFAVPVGLAMREII